MTEIFLPSDSEHSFVCCLSSVNIYKYKEWKNTDLIFLSILFLDAVMSEFLIFSDSIKELNAARNFAIKSRALGLGSLGFATYLQSNYVSYDGLQAQMHARIIYDQIRNQSEFASKYLGSHFGVPEWCKGSGRRNLTTTAIAPNRSSSMLAGNMSEGIQPYVGNVFVNQTAKGTFYQVNPMFKEYLVSIGEYNEEVIKSVGDRKGSCQHLGFMDKDSKDVFKTRFEINQMGLVKLTAVIQEYIEQGISCNLSFLSDAPPRYIYDTHILAWESGLKSLYYLKSESSISIDSVNSRLREEMYAGCVACEG